MWHSVGSISSRLWLRAVISVTQFWSWILHIQDYANIWALSFHSDVYLYCGPLRCDICSPVDIRKTRYHQVLWKYMQYVPPDVHLTTYYVLS